MSHEIGVTVITKNRSARSREYKMLNVVNIRMSYLIVVIYPKAKKKKRELIIPRFYDTLNTLCTTWPTLKMVYLPCRVSVLFWTYYCFLSLCFMVGIIFILIQYCVLIRDDLEEIYWKWFALFPEVDFSQFSEWVNTLIIFECLQIYFTLQEAPNI